MVTPKRDLQPNHPFSNHCNEQKKKLFFSPLNSRFYRPNKTRGSLGQSPHSYTTTKHHTHKKIYIYIIGQLCNVYKRSLRKLRWSWQYPCLWLSISFYNNICSRLIFKFDFFNLYIVNSYFPLSGVFFFFFIFNFRKFWFIFLSCFGTNNMSQGEKSEMCKNMNQNWKQIHIIWF